MVLIACFVKGRLERHLAHLTYKKTSPRVSFVGSKLTVVSDACVLPQIANCKINSIDLGSECGCMVLTIIVYTQHNSFNCLRPMPAAALWVVLTGKELSKRLWESIPQVGILSWGDFPWLSRFEVGNYKFILPRITSIGISISGLTKWKLWTNGKSEINFGHSSEANYATVIVQLGMHVIQVGF